MCVECPGALAVVTVLDGVVEGGEVASGVGCEDAPSHPSSSLIHAGSRNQMPDIIGKYSVGMILFDALDLP
tara:strand:+ start:14905 stop:15117 length:213 start_codon:yes stop_codon:yes gene_type:complete